MAHALVHVVIGVGLYKAGEAFDKRRRAVWLAVAAVGAVIAHQHHHRRLP